MTAAPPIHDGLADLVQSYDALIVDLWGVLHNGVEAYPDAVEALRALKQRNKTVLVLSNAPRPVRQIAARMAELGIPADLYDHLMSSGEDARHCLRDRPTAWYRALGRRLYHMGPARDGGVLAGLDVEVVRDPERADFILNTGPGDDESDLSVLDPLLEIGIGRGLPMICANPDLVVMRGNAPELCAGAVAARYADMGGVVHYHGKPHPAIYESCFARLGEPDRDRVLAVGDSLRTDVAGAARAGIDSAMVTGGIHAEALGVRMGESPDPRLLTDLCGREGIRPTYALPAFRW